jgi:hypothetical protein
VVFHGGEKLAQLKKKELKSPVVKKMNGFPAQRGKAHGPEGNGDSAELN